MGDDVDPERPSASPQAPGTPPGPAVVLHPGPPAWALAALLPSAAIALIWFRTAQSGLSAGPDDPAPPLLIAAITLIAALVLGWRALTQRAVLDDSGLHSRNLTVTYHLEWERIERLDIVHRPGLQIIEVRIHGLRRRHRLGAATRVAGDEADVVLDAVRAHPVAAKLLEDHRS
jgi:hypothetical protein